MTTSRVSTGLVSLILAALVTASCGQATTSSSAPLPPGAASPGPTGASTGTVPDPSLPAIDLVDPAGSVAAAELTLRQEVRERAGLVNLGPGALELAAAMDASAARTLTQLRLDAGAEALHGQIAAIGAPFPLAPSPGFNSWLVFGTLISVLDQLAKEPKSGTFEEPPETIEIAGNTGTRATTTTLKAVVSGSQLSVDITMKTKGQVVDRATGAVLYSIDSIVTGHIDVVFCPDAGGKSAANVKLTSSEIYVGGAGGSSAKGVSSEFSGSASISVDDDANIARVDGTQQGSEDAKGGVSPPGGGDAELTASTRHITDTIANDGQGSRLPGVPRDIKLGGEGSTPAAQQGMIGTTIAFVETMVMAVAKEAEKLWRSGKCVELIVTPDGGDVEANEVTGVTAALKHKIEGNELDKLVEATFTGKQSLDPASGKQPAPATVSHTAGPDQGDVGSIAFRSASNRGIAEKSVTFTVGSTAWSVAFKGTTTQTGNAALGPEKVLLAATISDLRASSKDGKLSGSGKLHLKGTHTAGCFKGSLDQVETLDLEGFLVGTGPDAVLRVTFRRPPASTGTIVMDCPELHMSMPSPVSAYTEFFWFVVGTVDLPAAGGTVAWDRAVELLPRSGTVSGTFTVTKVP